MKSKIRLSPVRIEDLARTALEVESDLRGPKRHAPPPDVLAAVVAAWTVYYKRLTMLIVALSPSYLRSSPHPGSSGFEAIRALIATQSLIDRHQERSPSPAWLLMAYGKVQKVASSDRFILEEVLGDHGKVLGWAFEGLAKTSLPAKRRGGS